MYYITQACIKYSMQLCAYISLDFVSIKLCTTYVHTYIRIVRIRNELYWHFSEFMAFFIQFCTGNWARNIIYYNNDLYDIYQEQTHY